jgi:hypothetical protein
MFNAAETALERTRSALWPLVLALGVGLSVGFAAGYAVANRPPLESRQVEPGQASDPIATDATAPRGVPETEVRVKSDARPTVPAAEPEARSGSAAPPPAKAPLPKTPAPARVEPPRASADSRSSPSTAKRAESNERGLLIQSTPPGATAFVDGREVGRTPVTVRSIAPGPHTVQVMHDGFVGQERKIAISASRPSQSVTFGLERSRTSPPPTPATPATIGRETAALIVESRPAGANVLVDGKPAGRTPLTLPEVAVGMHTISLELAGFNSWATSVRVAAGQKNRVAASLEEQ